MSAYITEEKITISKKISEQLTQQCTLQELQHLNYFLFVETTLR